jgi:hypothetical protein
VQNVVLLALIYHYQRRSVRRTLALLGMLAAWGLLAASGGLTRDHIALLYAVNNFLLLSARVPQIVQSQATRSTGQLSVVTYGLNVAGSAARIFTSIQEKAGPVMVQGAALSESWGARERGRGRGGKGKGLRLLGGLEWRGVNRRGARMGGRAPVRAPAARSSLLAQALAALLSPRRLPARPPPALHRHPAERRHGGPDRGLPRQGAQAAGMTRGRREAGGTLAARLLRRPGAPRRALGARPRPPRAAPHRQRRPAGGADRGGGGAAGGPPGGAAPGVARGGGLALRGPRLAATGETRPRSRAAFFDATARTLPVFFL